MPATRKVWFATACRSASPFVINFNWGAPCARQREIGSLIASYTLKTQGLVGEGRFERPTPCAQGIDALPPFDAATGCQFN
jgi:hypothetical protein